MNTDALGHRLWAFSAGDIPAESTGHEPSFTSRDDLCVLNTGARDAELTITVYLHDEDPIGPFTFLVGAERVRHVRVNDLIDPQAIPLGVPYALVVRSEEPVIAQIRRIDTRRDGLATTITTGHAFDLAAHPPQSEVP